MTQHKLLHPDDPAWSEEFTIKLTLREAHYMRLIIEADIWGQVFLDTRTKEAGNSVYKKTAELITQSEGWQTGKPMD